MIEVLNENMIKKLTENEKRVYRYLLSNNIENLKIKEIAKDTYTSTATVIRMAKKLGFRGYKELSYKILSKNTMIECDITNQMFEIKNYNQLNELSKLVDNGRTLCYGEGLANTIVLYIYKKLLLLGRNVELFNSEICQIILEKEKLEKIYDVVIIISKFGRENISCKLATYLKTTGTKVIVVTINEKSSLYEMADLGFNYKDYKDNNFTNIYPTLFFGYIILLFEKLLKSYSEKKYNFLKKVQSDS